MSYTCINFPTKKALKEALKRGENIQCYNPGLGPELSEYTGTVWLEGPHYPKLHTWCAVGLMVDGLLKSVK